MGEPRPRVHYHDGIMCVVDFSRAAATSQCVGSDLCLVCELARGWHACLQVVLEVLRYYVRGHYVAGALGTRVIWLLNVASARSDF